MIKKEPITHFKFIDLFAGIGGFHLAMHSLGGECVFASEIDQHARKTYEHNFINISPKLFEKGLFNSDIRTIMPNEIPDFDMFTGGFPCHPFSSAGLGKGKIDIRGKLISELKEVMSFRKTYMLFRYEEDFRRDMMEKLRKSKKEN